LTKTTSYASVLAKIGAERSKLLSEAKVKALADSKDLSEFAAQLRDTSYQEQISKLSPPLTSRKLERAFNESLIENYLKIIKYSPKKAQKFLEVYLLRLEFENIKALMKATSAKLSSEQKTAKVYFSVEDYFKKRVVVEEALKASSPIQIVHAFKGTEYFLPLSLGQKNFEENHSTASFDVFIDKFFYEKLFEGYQSLPKDEQSHADLYASTENDGFTLLTLLRGKMLNYDPNYLRLVVPQNFMHIDRATMETLVSAVDFEGALKIVLNSYYAKFFSKAATPAETVSAAEKALRKARYQRAKSAAISEAFNIEAPLAFLTQKEAEVRNLVALSVGIDAGIKPDDIRSILFF
jgi:V/A-type H+/Na+-transporting ATPase subunit C